MKSVIYARTSSVEQDPQKQVEDCKKAAKEHGYEVLETFVDHGYSGLENERPSFKKMIDYLDNHENTTVIISSASVISRDSHEFDKLMAKYKLRSGKKLEVPFADHMSAMLHNGFMSLDNE